jgi:hypothetical protein
MDSYDGLEPGDGVMELVDGFMSKMCGIFKEQHQV